MFIIHLGSSGFPLGKAQMQRIRLTFKSIKMAGFSPLIINKHSVHPVVGSKSINRFQGIPYISTSIIKKKPGNLIIRNLNKISGFIGEFNLLIKKHRKIGAAIFYGISFSELVYYRLLSKLFGFKLVIQYVEFRSSTNKGLPLFKRINNSLFDNYCASLCDGVIVISEYLKNRIISKSNSPHYIKIPAICDFAEFENGSSTQQREYMMYCGAIGYLSVIEFIIDIYCRLRELNIYDKNLVLAIGVGDEDKEQYNKFKDKLNSSKYSESINLFINVPYDDLVMMYLKADLLIIPLRNELQDIAGFHHKIGEYTASRKPFISTNLGEVRHYFQDGESAILADEFIVDSYLTKLTGILSDRGKLEQIADNGYRIGYEHLNYTTYAPRLKIFFEQICR